VHPLILDTGVSKELAREVKEFNVRVLTVNMSVFDTNMRHVLQFQEQPLDSDYDKTMVNMFLKRLKYAQHEPEGDTQKAVKAIYEVVVGEGVGEGREEELVLPLGKDMERFVYEQMAQWKHTMEVFGDVCRNADHEK
jgi:hypothetical protein